MISIRLVRFGASLLGLLIIFEAVTLGLGSHAVETDSSALALQLAGVSADAAAFAGRKALDSSAGQAENLGQSALQRSPLNVEALSTLALAREKQGRDRDATALMNLAAEAGWWDDATQIWMFDRARDVGRYEVAMERADALLRRETLQDALFPLLVEMAREPDGMSALISRLEEKPSWRPAFLQWLSYQEGEDERNVDRFWRLLARSGAPPSTRELAARINGLVEHRRYATAQLTWVQSRAKHRTSALVFDGQFDDASKPLQDGPATPFQWGFADDAAATTAIDLPSQPISGVALNVNVDPGFSSEIATQLIVLSPGFYQLDYAVSRSGNEDLNSVFWSVRCVDGGPVLPPNQTFRHQRPDGWNDIRLTFEVPADCPAQFLQLRGNGQALASGEFWLDRISISHL